MAENWNISGTYFEACNCEAVCQCFFLSPPDPEECTVLIACHIDRGRMGDVNLNELNVALGGALTWSHGPGAVEGCSVPRRTSFGNAGKRPSR